MSRMPFLRLSDESNLAVWLPMKFAVWSFQSDERSPADELHLLSVRKISALNHVIVRSGALPAFTI